MLAGFLLLAVPGAVAKAERPLVVIVDGAGGKGVFTAAFRDALARSGLPVDTEAFYWSSRGTPGTPDFGPAIKLRDLTDSDRAVRMGACLAGRLRAVRRTSPQRRIVLVGYSSGAAIVLAALQSVDADSIERLILLAPAVAVETDLGPALRACRLGLDSFHSRRDIFALGIAIRAFGTTDPSHSRRAAGRFGFRGPGAGSPKLRQHFWEPAWRAFGHEGFHDGVKAPGFLNAFVFPLLLPGTWDGGGRIAILVR